MDVEFILDGKSPILLHNPRMVDPQFEINREIKSITSKRKKTDEDLRRVEELEWWGGLYTEAGDEGEIVVQPTAKVRKCFIGAARISKEGKNVERALSFLDLNVPLIHDGPKDLKKLSQEQRFRSRLSVGVNGKRVMRCRPQFYPWRLIVRGVFIEDAGINWDTMCDIAALAGQVEGIGDNRVNGYGRFACTAKKI